ncbi:hypothetical protein ABPG72_021264 [Tetrahymena utriculariae]
MASKILFKDKVKHLVIILLINFYSKIEYNFSNFGTQNCGCPSNFGIFQVKILKFKFKFFRFQVMKKHYDLGYIFQSFCSYECQIQLINLSKKIEMMEVEYQNKISLSDASEYVKGMIYALKQQNYFHQAISGKVIVQGLPLSKSSVQEFWSDITKNGCFESLRKTWERQQKLAKENKDLIINTAENNHFLTTAEIQKDKQLIYKN